MTPIVFADADLVRRVIARLVAYTNLQDREIDPEAWIERVSDAEPSLTVNQLDTAVALWTQFQRAHEPVLDGNGGPSDRFIQWIHLLITFKSLEAA